MSDFIVTFDEKAVRDKLKKLVRRTVEDALNSLLEEETDDLIGADRYERPAEREAYRAGHYDRGLTIASSQVTLKIPKLMGMRFGAAIIERHKRRKASIEKAMIEMFLVGISTRHIEDVSEILWGSSVSTATMPTSTRGVRNHRGVKEQTTCMHLPLCLHRRYLPEVSLGRCLRERGCNGSHRRQRWQLPRSDRSI